jgi:hypothetical protein
MEIKFNILRIVDKIINELIRCKAGKKVRILNIGCGIPKINFELIFHLITNEKENLLQHLELINTDKEETENAVYLERIVNEHELKIAMPTLDMYEFKDIIQPYLKKGNHKNDFCEKYKNNTPKEIRFFCTPENEFKETIEKCTNYYEKISTYKKMDIIEDFNLYETLCTTKEDKFSVIICEQLLHFKSIRNKTPQIIELFSKLIKPGGHIIVRVNHDKNTIKNSDKSNQYNLFSESEFNDLFREYPNIVPTDNLQKTNKWISQIWKYQKKRQNNLK